MDTRLRRMPLEKEDMDTRLRRMPLEKEEDMDTDAAGEAIIWSGIKLLIL